MKTIFLAEFIMFYIFFFVRAKVLSKKIGMNIKANDSILNVAILSAGLSAIFFMIEEFVKPVHEYLIVIMNDIISDYIGLAFISIGLILSVLSSLNLGSSWRIGVNYSKKTELVTSGFYKISRNPYFTSYDVVLIGTMISSGSIVVSKKSED